MSNDEICNAPTIEDALRAVDNAISARPEILRFYAPHKSPELYTTVCSIDIENLIEICVEAKKKLEDIGLYSPIMTSLFRAQEANWRALKELMLFQLEVEDLDNENAVPDCDDECDI